MNSAIAECGAEEAKTSGSWTPSRKDAIMKATSAGGRKRGYGSIFKKAEDND